MKHRFTLITIFLLIAFGLTAVAAPQAHADVDEYGVPSLAEDGWYNALYQYVGFLDGRADKPANATQRQGFRDQLVYLTNNAAADVLARSDQRLNVAYAANRAALNADLASFQADLSETQAEAVADYEDTVKTATEDYQEQLKDAKDNLADKQANISDSLQTAVASFQGHGSSQSDTVTRSCKVARRVAAKAVKRFGKKSKQALKAKRAVVRVCAGSSSSNNYDYSDAQGIADAKKEAQSDSNSAVADFNDTKASLADRLKEITGNAKARRDQSIQDATDQYNSSAAQATDSANAEWTDTAAYLMSIYSDEMAQVSYLYNQGDSDIRNYPH